MKQVEPKVYLIAEPRIIGTGMYEYLDDVGGTSWMARHPSPLMNLAQGLVEFAGRICYRSWKPGLNRNVRKIRTNDYLRNIIDSGHGSVLEHANFTFVFHGVSRVFTHELARHRAGIAISQESMRFVRLDKIPMWIPEWAQADPELMGRVREEVDRQEDFQQWMAEHFDLDVATTDFSTKKAKTSFMRRFAPDGVATDVVWTANVRALRHVIEARTAPGAEEEMRLVFGRVAEIMKETCPELFYDFECENGTWTPRNHKV